MELREAGIDLVEMSFVDRIRRQLRERAAGVVGLGTVPRRDVRVAGWLRSGDRRLTDHVLTSEDAERLALDVGAGNSARLASLPLSRGT